MRNELQALTEMGHLRQPHTSAGRVPTEEGYRYFVSQMINQAELPVAVQHTISHQFRQASPDIEAAPVCMDKIKKSLNRYLMAREISARAAPPHKIRVP